MGSQLRILSANLYCGNADPDALAEVVNRFEPDVLAVQELGPRQAEMLASLLPCGELEPDDSYNGMGIAARWPVRTTRIPLGERDAHVAHLHPDDWPALSHAFEVVNVHITAPHSYPFWVQPFRRRRQLDGVLSHIAADPDRSRAVVGDFNATPLWPVYRRFAACLTDVVREHARAQGTRPRPTWPHGFAVPLIRIDHCFSSDLSAEHVETFQVPGSDHLALGVSLALE